MERGCILYVVLNRKIKERLICLNAYARRRNPRYLYETRVRDFPLRLVGQDFLYL